MSCKKYKQHKTCGPWEGNARNEDEQVQRGQITQALFMLDLPNTHIGILQITKIAL